MNSHGMEEEGPLPSPHPCHRRASFNQVLLTNALWIKLAFSDFNTGTVVRGVNLAG